MAASITDQFQHLELSPVAPTSPSSQPKRQTRGLPRRRARLGKNRTPNLPPELIADIIELTVEILVEEERHLASQIPLTNHFLLSAALVDRTWHSIASPALLKNGLVTPNVVEEFLAQIEQRGMKETLDRVRFGAGAVGLANDRPSTEGADDTPLLLLPSSLSRLASLELVGIGLRLSSDLKGLPAFKYLSTMIQIGNTLANVWKISPLDRLRSNPITNSHFPALTALSMYLGPLHFFATIGERPSLVSVHVLEGDPDEASYTLDRAEISLLEVIKNLPALRSLKVPACWRSEAVEEACEAKGIELRWT
ncbi:hypothetical protein RQP46_008079 [Phenoliferia psychrophenolica]